MTFRKQIAIGLFLIGFAVSLLIVPMTICRPLGFRGTSTADTQCTFQGYYLVHKRPKTPYTDTTQIRIDHGRVFVFWSCLILVSVLIGTDYKKGNNS